MNHSNQGIRNRSIIKALLLTVLPMLFSGVGGYFISKVETVKQTELEGLKKELVAKDQQIIELEKQDSLLVASMTTLNEDWKAYFDKHLEYLNKPDSTSIERLKNEVETKGRNLLNNIKNFTIVNNKKHEGIHKNLHKRFDSYLNDLMNYRNLIDLKEETPEENSECCEELTTKSGEIMSVRNNLSQSQNRLSSCNGRLGTLQERLDLSEERKQSFENKYNDCNKSKKKKFLMALSPHLDRKLKPEGVEQILRALGFD